jgi:hypothetical protein
VRGPPARAGDGFLLGYAAIEIDAPAERVFAALTDFAGYAAWNPFTPRIEGEARVGAALRIHVRMGPLSLVERGTLLTLEPGELLGWHVFPMPRLLAWGDRRQRVEALGPGRCRYSSEDRLHGALSPLVAPAFRSIVSRGFAAAAAGLKRYVEGQPR